MAVASRPASEPAPGPESESNAGPGRLMSYELSLRKFSLTLQPSSHDSPRWRGSLLPRSGRGLSPCARNTIREAISRDRHAEQPACSTRCPKEPHAYLPHAQRSWHLQRSPPAQSEGLRTEVWFAESLRRRAARPTPRSHWLLELGGHEIGSVSACGEQVGGQLYRWLRGL